MKKKISIEEAINELEEITSKLEDEDILLSDNLKLCERANLLIKFCENELNDAKQKIVSLHFDE